MITLPSIGLHYGVSFEDYTAWPAINFSRLKPIRNSPSKCRYEMDHPKEQTPAMAIGSALHVATLEPGRFDSMFYIAQPCDRRTKEGKVQWEAMEKEAAGKTMIRAGSDDNSQLSLIKGMAKSIQSSKAATLFLSQPGHNEVSALWRDVETGLMCKGRFDRLVTHSLMEMPVIIELKSTKDARSWSFGKDCHTMQYAAQAASYCYAHEIITGVKPMHVFIAVENFPPHDVMTHMLDDEDLAVGYKSYRDMLTIYARCVKEDKWPGYEDKINKLKLPAYALE